MTRHHDALTAAYLKSNGPDSHVSAIGDVLLQAMATVDALAEQAANQTHCCRPHTPPNTSGSSTTTQQPQPAHTDTPPPTEPVERKSDWDVYIPASAFRAMRDRAETAENQRDTLIREKAHIISQRDTTRAELADMTAARDTMLDGIRDVTRRLNEDAIYGYTALSAELDLDDITRAIATLLAFDYRDDPTRIDEADLAAARRIIKLIRYHTGDLTQL